MMAFSRMLVPAALQANIKVPSNPDDFDEAHYPHWHVFCLMQLGQRLPRPTSHWDNAKVIASVPDSAIRTITASDLIALGFEI